MLKCWTRIFIYFASVTLDLYDWFTDRYLLYDVGNSLMEASRRKVLHNYGHSKLLFLSSKFSLYLNSEFNSVFFDLATLPRRYSDTST